MLESISIEKLKVCNYCSKRFLSNELFNIHQRTCILKNYYELEDSFLKKEDIKKIILVLNLLWICTENNNSIVSKSSLLNYIQYFTQSVKENAMENSIIEDIRTIIFNDCTELYSIHQRFKIISNYVSADVEHIKIINDLYKNTLR